MVTNNEVLTVSYGTFSCTLEGFDESFDTMKAIAEYFRDLAADDRYFGAEPPTPDAEMLARIAEHEIERRVQARTEHGAIVLSAKSPAVAAEVSQDIPDAPQEVVAEMPAEVSKEDVSPVVVAPVIEVAEIARPAEELETVSDVVAIEEPEDEPEVIDVTDSVLEAISVDAEDIQEDTDVDEAPLEIEVAEVQDIEEIATDDVEGNAEEETEDGDVLAAMISRVEEDVVAEEADEVETAEIEDVQEDAMIADILDADTSPVEEVDLVEATEVEPVEVEAEDVAELEEHVEDEAPIAEIVETIEPVKVVADDDSIAAKLQRIRAVVSKSADQPDEDDFIEDEHADNLLDEPVAETASVLSLDGQMAAAAKAEDAPAEGDVAEDVEVEATEEPARPIRARVVRMKKSDFESAVDTGLLEAVPVEDDEDDQDEAELSDNSESSLSDEEEAELLAELAEVEAEVSDTDLDDEPVEAIGADFEDAPEDDRPVRGHHLTDVSSQTDADMSRLLGEAQNQLDEPGGSRRRQAIAHLRAAVAATKAEKNAGVTDDTRDAAEVYRDDLASVVRPVPSTERPSSAEKSQDDKPRDPAPLKLVAEQRIDTPQEEAPAPATEAPRVPVRPRRVAGVDQLDRDALVERDAQTDRKALGDTDASSFSEFAESVGANQLHEVLEAAAAYLTYVEGHNVFSRPMVMRMVSSMDVEEFTREDSLRGFGQLLRENKIEKVSGGRFTASDEIGFKPEDRATG